MEFYNEMYSKVTLKKIEKLCKRFCINPKIKLVFTSDKLRQTFTYKYFYQSVFSSVVVYKFVCASCNASKLCWSNAPTSHNQD